MNDSSTVLENKKIYLKASESWLSVRYFSKICCPLRIEFTAQRIFIFKSFSSFSL